MISDADVASFQEAYFLSNTPDYLLRRFLQNPLLAEIRKRTSAKELYEIATREADASQNLSEQLRRCVAFVALLTAEASESRKLIEQYKPLASSWRAFLIAAWDRIRRPATTNSIPFVPTIPAQDGLRSTSSTTATKLFVTR